MNKRVIYDVKWKEQSVGVVYANDNNEYQYIPNIENIYRLSKEGMPSTLVIRPQREWKKTLPKFIERRLKINSESYVTVTDHFSIVKSNERV